MAVTSVWKVLNTSLSSSTLKVFKYEKEKNYSGTYIAVNHLPFVHREAVEEGTVNINIHVPELANGRPDTLTLSTMTATVAAMFPQNTYIEGAYYEYYCDSRPTPDNDKTYYVNLQLKVTYNNLNG